MPPDEFVHVGRCASTGEDITLSYQCFGKRENPCLLLIMGLNCPGVYWDTQLCNKFSNAGFYVVRYDNRDVGLSTHLDAFRSASIVRLALPRWLSLGEGKPIYTLEDMATDGLQLLTALGIERAHVLGTSMGGMIAQCMAIAHPERLLSLTLLSTSCSVPPPPSLALCLQLLKRHPTELDALVEHELRFVELISGSLPFNKEAVRDGLRETFGRSSYRAGGSRQLMAIARASDREAGLATLNASSAMQNPPTGTGLWSLLSEIEVVGRLEWLLGRSRKPKTKMIAAASPTTMKSADLVALPVLVFHGGADAMIPVREAERLARLIPGSKLVVVPSMGHYFPASMFDHIVDEVVLLAMKSVAPPTAVPGLSL